MEIHMAPHLELEHDVIYFDKGDPKVSRADPTLVQQPKPANIWKRIDHLPQPGPMGQRRLQVPPRFRKPPHLRSKEMPDYKKDLDDWFKANHIDPKLLIGGVLGMFKDYEDAPDDDPPPGSGNDDD
jgi:hypothetical protein